MLDLDKRCCTQGVNLNTRRQKYGKEKVPAKDVRLFNVLLSKPELNAFFDNEHAWDMLYVERAGKPAEPFWGQRIATFDIPGKWRESSAVLNFGLAPYMVSFAEATISRVSLHCQTGGLTALSCTLSCLKANIAGDLSRLDDYLDAVIECALEFGEPGDDDEDDEDQDELDLDHRVGTPEQEHDKAHARENALTQQLADDRKPPKRASQRRAPTGDAVN